LGNTGVAAGSDGVTWVIIIMAWAMGTAFCLWSAGFARGFAAGTEPIAGVDAAMGALVATVGTDTPPASKTVIADAPAHRAFRTHTKVTRRTLVQNPAAHS
jgi:hypothetical protein